MTVAGTGGADGPAPSGDDAFLRLGGPEAKADDDARVEAGGHTLRLGPSRSAPTFGGRVKIKFPTPVPGSERVEARAPDPGGGPGHGLLVAQTREGPPCVAQPSQIAGSRAGAVELRLALFAGGAGLSPGSCRPLQPTPDTDRAPPAGLLIPTGFPDRRPCRRTAPGDHPRRDRRGGAG
ncbi:hypothetical protein [Candidatus Solirubrobacter pratensis]|uniref:hypothetical protein n=1 Tax=Candidatus Solirubrobacter pratensis TaxID=1298857 RepID=UPI0004875592|nr:hypothetical protein [Candidatus Solirubrobacter pratensis]